MGGIGDGSTGEGARGALPWERRVYFGCSRAIIPWVAYVEVIRLCPQ